MTNPLPQATHEWHPTETVDLDAVRPLAVELLQNYRVTRGQPQTVRAGHYGFAQVKAPDTVTGPDGEHQVYLNGDERACTCGGANCLHINAVAAAELVAA